MDFREETELIISRAGLALGNKDGEKGKGKRQPLSKDEGLGQS